MAWLTWGLYLRPIIIKQPYIHNINVVSVCPYTLSKYFITRSRLYVYMCLLLLDQYVVNLTLLYEYIESHTHTTTIFFAWYIIKNINSFHLLGFFSSSASSIISTYFCWPLLNIFKMLTLAVRSSVVWLFGLAGGMKELLCYN